MVQMFHDNNEKQKRQMTEGIELTIQKEIRTHGEKETYEYLGKLKADTNRDKRKVKKRIP